MMNISHPLHNFIPYRITAGEELLCSWLHLGQKRFTEPFFEETILKCRYTGINSHAYTSSSTVEGMIAAAQEIESIPPTVFIFHVSRCGSTLLSQLLSLDEEHIVLSEVPLLDEIMRVHHDRLPKGMEDDALRAAIKLMGQARTGREKYLFIKLDSWHIVYWRKLRELYPEVPFVLLYRSPAGVVRSHRKYRGLQMVPGLLDPALLGLEPHEAQDTHFDSYTAKVLERFYKGFIDVITSDDRSMMADYDEGIMNIIQRIALHTGIKLGPGSLLAMEQRSSFHSKRGDEVFAEPAAEVAVEDWMVGAVNSYGELAKLMVSR